MTPRWKLPGLLALLLTFGCTQIDPSLTVPAGQGQLAARLTSASSGPVSLKPASGSPGAPSQVKEIHVTVVKVTAHSAQSGWTTLSTDTVPVDILNLKNSITDLGVVNLPEGDVSQIRLYTASDGNYVVLADGSHADLKVPSGAQSGIKVHGPFSIHGCKRETVDLEFSGPHSIQYHATGTGEYILRPVIRATHKEEISLTCTGSPDGGASEPDGGAPPPPPPPPSGPGSACTAPSDCLSGDCQGTCQPGATGTPCTAGSDCASDICQADGTCGGTAGGSGAPCTLNSECLSGSCVNSTCGTGGQGTPCTGDTDCATGFSCIDNTCLVILN